MAGEIEEPFRLDFQVDSFHSGSISFGRFESEALCWERRSSFSHNRYLEEVEKCSKPGSVTEKKAYFEAHFRKKGFPVLSPPECRNDTDHQINENDISEKMCNDEEIDHMNISTCSAQFDESLDGSVHGGDHEVMGCETEVFGSQFELASDNISNVECITEHVNVDKADDAKIEGLLSINSESGIDIKENVDDETAELVAIHESNMAIGMFPNNYANQENFNASSKDKQSSSPKEKIPSKSEHKNPRLVPRFSDGQSRRYTSRNTTKGSENKANNNVRDVPVRCKAEKKTSEDPKKFQMQRTKKYERGLKTKGVDEINSAEKEPRNRTIVEPQPSTSQKVPSRAYQSANRVKPAVGITKAVTRQDTSRSIFKSNERSQRRKEFDMKLESKMHAKEAEMHQRQARTQATPSNIEPQKQHAKSSIPRFRLSESSSLSAKARIDQATSTSARRKTDDPAEASGVTSCYSTVTSDSCASSSARTSKYKPSQAGVSPTSWKKEPEKEKLTSLRKNKVPEGNRIHKGKTSDGKQKTRIGRSTYASFNGSSRAGYMAVGVAH